MNLVLNRRQALLAGVGAVAAASGMAGASAPALAAAEDAAATILEFTGGAEPTMGRVTLDVPEIAENGNTVPMDVWVDSPMTADDYVAEVLVVADGNPRPGVATFHFSPLSGRAQANTRIRLAGTQNVIAVAKMSDGSVFMDKKEVKVTIGGCGG
ncbi:thiosulfate oxidation carrier protein SoxY [Salinarimonas rosea]|uniref:thiosulfate oxidation carrier protein SoxY n=1 Tax=Salinarimonas rosea TaxID=552063 RepID=UPI000425CDE9|nr:thiosulfate oxidation carrier protein SoxY [Salinarimonas rosea]